MLMLVLASLFVPWCHAGVRSARAHGPYERVHLAYDIAKMEPRFACDEKGSLAVIDFHEDAKALSLHKIGDPFYLVSHTGEIVEAILARSPVGPQDPNCRTVVDERIVDGTTVRHHYGVLKLKRKLMWSEYRSCYDPDAVMAIDGVKPKSPDIGAVYEAVDDLNDSGSPRVGGDPRTLELARTVRPRIRDLAEPDSFHRDYYRQLMIGEAFRLVSPDRKQEFLFENLSGPADGAISFLFRVDPSGPTLLRHGEDYACIFNVSNFNHGVSFEMLEDHYSSRLSSREELRKIDEPDENRTIKKFGFMLGD